MSSARARLVISIALALGGLLLALCMAGVESADGQPPLAVTVSFDSQEAGRPVSREFLGLSFEAAALGQISQYGERGDMVRLLRSLGPGMLRFGGITSDQNVAWSDAETPRPAWAVSVIGPAQMNALGVLVRRSGWQVLLTVGLAHYDPAAAAREVAAASRALGPYLAAVEIGNEPNAYGSHGFRELPWIAQGYEEEVTSYREAIAALTPGVQIAGPDVSGSGIFPEWGGEEVLAQRPALLTGHHYPLGCAQIPAPSIEGLLSSATRGREARSLATYMSVSLASGIPLRIDEANSVSCGGSAGISNTFASALWASGYIAQAMAEGTAGINLQGNPSNCAGYTPVCATDPAALAEGRLLAEPDWYALLLTRSLIGYRPLPTTITTQGSPNLVAAAFTGPGHSLKAVFVDDEPPGAAPLTLQLQVPGKAGVATVQRLTGASPGATDGVLLAGRAVAANGSWSPPAQMERLPARSGAVALTLEPSSAALLTITPVSAKKQRGRGAPRGGPKR